MGFIITFPEVFIYMPTILINHFYLKRPLKHTHFKNEELQDLGNSPSCPHI